jgi:acetaldehyde dehydrogenase (acetylating)
MDDPSYVELLATYDAFAGDDGSVSTMLSIVPSTVPLLLKDTVYVTVPPASKDAALATLLRMLRWLSAG